VQVCFAAPRACLATPRRTFTSTQLQRPPNSTSSKRLPAQQLPPKMTTDVVWLSGFMTKILRLADRVETRNTEIGPFPFPLGCADQKPTSNLLTPATTPSCICHFIGLPQELQNIVFHWLWTETPTILIPCGTLLVQVEYQHAHRVIRSGDQSGDRMVT
jgi:hypothetical protein